MDTIIGASLTTRTDGLGTARYSDPVSGRGGGGGYQGPQGLQGDDGSQGWQGDTGPQGFQGSGGGGSGTPGDTIPVIISKVGIVGTGGPTEPYRRDGTVPGLKLVGTPADATPAAHPSLEFTTGESGLQIKTKPYSPNQGTFKVDSQGVYLPLLSTGGLGNAPDGVNIKTNGALATGPAGLALLLAPNGALSQGADLSVNVDGVTVQVNGLNQLISTGGGGTPGETIPLIVSKAGVVGTGGPAEPYRRNGTVAGLKLVGDPADVAARYDATLQFTTGDAGLQVKLSEYGALGADQAYLLADATGIFLPLNRGLEKTESGLEVKVDSPLAIGAAGVDLQLAAGGALMDSSGLAVKVDNDSIKINGSNQLTAPGISTPGNTLPVAVNNTGIVGTSETLFCRDDTRAGVKLVGDHDDGIDKYDGSLEFTTGAQGLQLRFEAGSGLAVDANGVYVVWTSAP